MDEPLNGYVKKLLMLASGLEKIADMMPKPKKTTVISKDDIINIKISLNTCNDVSEFISII